ncbi:MAG: hypothetical protein KKF12_10880 [Proteobacteria bacterium]|nr:hypothetical protein [Desulfobacula sp.]MBU3952377.1 hypothetical protein [Pseudomonadota bacterium]MBU4131312.1 hypothetical protein [Pseudomonadota bacterium]
MKTKHLSYFLSLVFLLAIFVAAVYYNTSKPRVMILHSYNPGYAWTRDVDIGLGRVVDNWTGYSVTWHYMATKQHSDPEWLRRSGIIARRAIERTNPKVLIAIDDLAQSLAAQYFVNDPNMEIVFAGVNGSIEPYGYPGAVNVTGIYERKQLGAVRDAILALENNKVPPDPHPKLIYVLDPSLSLEKDRASIDAFAWAPIRYSGSIVAQTFDDWKKIILEKGPGADYIIVANYRKLPVSESDPTYADPKEVMSWTDKNSKTPVVGIQSFNVEDGAMICIGVSPFEQGEVAAKMAQTILEKKIRANQIPIRTNNQCIVAIREFSLAQRRMALPAIYESFGRATENYIEK